MNSQKRKLRDLQTLSAEERAKVLYTWNETDAAFPGDKCLHQLIEEQVERTPEAIAVTFDGQSLTFSELNARANSLANYLVENGVGPETLVGVSLKRSLELIVALLGVLKAGGAYVPLDPDLPETRLAFMLDDIQAPVLITHSALANKFAGYQNLLVSIDAGEEIFGRSTHNPVCITTPENAIYAIYTSGSTGKPKAVLNIHRAVVNRITWMRDRYLIGANDKILHKTPFSFDVSVWELFLPLISGARLVIAKPDQHRDPDALVGIIKTQEITAMHFVPSMLALFLEADKVGECRSLRYVFSSGEALSYQLQERFFSKLDCELVNFYGPTEAAIDVTHWTCARSSALKIVPLGRPIANTQLYILDSNLQPMPTGAVGELCIAGIGLARCYLNRAELTAEKFVPDPHSRVAGSRLYKTGDLARHLPTGDIEFLGRVDQQVKLHGNRIELGEIESVLRELELVHDAAVIVHTAKGQQQLVAYVVPSLNTRANGDTRQWLSQLRETLALQLPDYMAPNTFVVMERLPLSSSGKIDRKSLPEPSIDPDLVAENYVAPRTELEQQLVEIWSGLLPVSSKFGVNDNFFRLGGDSITSIQVTAAARRAGLHFEVKDIFEAPTVSQLTSRVKVVEGSPEPRVELSPFSLLEMTKEQRDRLWGDKGDVEDGYPLSPMQEGLLFRSIFLPESDSYFNQNVLKLTGDLDEAALRAAWQHVMDHYEILRTGFIWNGVPQPVQYVLKHVEVPWKSIDWTDVPAGQHADSLQSLLRADRKHTFDLVAPPQLRLQCVKLSSDQWYLAWSHHHVLLDGWCLSLVWGSVFKVYEQLVKGEKPFLPPTRPYRDFIAWINSQDKAGASERFWREYLAGFAEPTRFVSPQNIHVDSEYQNHVVRYSVDLTSDLKQLAQRNQVTLNVLVQAAWSLMLRAFSAKDDVVFGMSVSGRPVEIEEIEDMVGLFINTLPLRVKFNRNMPLNELLQQVQESVVRINQFSHVPLAQVKTLTEISLGGESLFDSLIAFENYPEDKLPVEQVAGITIEDVFAIEKTEYPLGLIVLPGRQLEFHFNYDTRLFSREAIQQFASQFSNVLNQMLQQPELNVSRISLVDEATKNQILYQWNDTIVDYGSVAGVYEMFERVAKRQPDAVAVSSEQGGLTYEELQTRAGQLGWRLQQLGVGPETPVCVQLERSVELVVALLGILRAGGVYVPLDPALPEQRRGFILRDTQAPVLLLGAAGDVPDEYSGQVVRLDEELWARAERAEWVEASGAQLAYIMYTSGSTGEPKGVMSTQLGLVNRLEWSLENYGLSEQDVLLQNAAVGFDISVWEMLFPLVAGGRLVVAGAEPQRDASALLAQVEREGVTVIHLVPTLLGAVVDQVAENGGGERLRWVVTGGEALRPELRQRFEEQFEARLFHAYGPTEASISVAHWECPRGEELWHVPIGKPIANTQLYLLDEHQELVGPGVVGEIYIGGVGVGRGYVGRADLTAERFVCDRFSGVAGSVLYRTGDRGRYVRDGNIEYVGRSDRQVKVRGQRVELGEVEAVLNGQNGVGQAAVVSREGRGGVELVGYVKLSGNGSGEKEAAAALVGRLKAGLRERLPEYMVPGRIMVVDDFPLTPNGKIRYESFVADASQPFTNQSSDSPVARNYIGSRLTEIWERLLGVSGIGVSDDFFDLGGHSLVAIRLVSEIDRAFPAHNVNITHIFKQPTIAALTNLIAEKLPGQAPSPLMKISSEGKRSIFLVHPGEGLAYVYTPLAKHLEGVRLYGINNPVFGNSDGSFQSVKEMASTYLEYIRREQPEGPYMLGGWSFGGVVAFEMARQLKEQGQRTELLLLIDSYNLSAFPEAKLEPNSVEGFLMDQGVNPDSEEGSKLHWELTNNGTLARQYYPSSYDGKVVLLKASRTAEVFADSPAAKDNGWGPYTGSSLEIHSIAGDHEQVFQARHISGLAQKIQSVLEQLETTPVGRPYSASI